MRSITPRSFSAPSNLVLRSSRRQDAQKVAGSGGTLAVPRSNEYVRKYMMSDFLMESACFTGFARDYTLRYPFY